MEVSSVQSTTGNSLETSKAQQQQGTNPMWTQYSQEGPYYLSHIKFHVCADVIRKTKYYACCWFSFVCFVCIFSANLTITPDPISVSEGQSFSIKCISDVSNYDEVYWNTSAGIKIHQRFFTSRNYMNGAESVLTVNTSTREWNGEWRKDTLSCFGVPKRQQLKGPLPETSLHQILNVKHYIDF